MNLGSEYAFFHLYIGVEDDRKVSNCGDRVDCLQWYNRHQISILDEMKKNRKMTLHYGTDLFEDISSSLKLTQANEIIRQASPEATNFIRKLGYSASNDGIKVNCWRVYEALRVHRADITQFHPHLVWSLPRRRSKYSRVDENILTISS